jgi:hypothetical protein
MTGESLLRCKPFIILTIEFGSKVEDSFYSLVIMTEPYASHDASEIYNI